MGKKMKLDDEAQRNNLLGLLAASQFPGAAIDEVYALKKAIETAEIEGREKTCAGGVESRKAA